MKTNQSLSVDGARVVYDTAGSGRDAVVFVHGGFGSSSELWHRAMLALPQGWTGYALNNFIRSDPPPDGYGVQPFARRVAGFIAALGHERAVIAGHSMGGVVCQLAALGWPERLSGLVLVGTGPSMKRHGIGQALLDQLKREGMSRDTIVSVSKNFFYADPPAGFFDGYVERALQAPLAAMIAVQQTLLDTDVVDRLPQITAPTLIIHGRHDHGRPVEHAMTLHNGIPGSRLAIIESSGHTPQLEAPVEFDCVLHGFLDDVSAGTAPAPSQPARHS